MHASNAKEAKITIALSVQMSLCKTRVQYLRVPKDVFRHVIKDHLSWIMLARNVIELVIDA